MKYRRNFSQFITNIAHVFAWKATVFHPIKCLSWGVLLMLSMGSNAQFNKYSNEFMMMGAGARAFAMGKAQIASAPDAYSGCWNPAALADLGNHSAYAVMHANSFAGIANYDYCAAAFPIRQPAHKNMGLGFSFLRLTVKDIPHTIFMVEPDSTINNNNIHAYAAAEYAMLLSFGKTLYRDDRRNLSFGTNVKLMHRSVGTFAKSWGAGFDIGLWYRSKNINVGAVVRNFPTTFQAWSFSFTEKEKEVLYLTNNQIPIQSADLTIPCLYLGAAYHLESHHKFSFHTEINLEINFDARRNVLLSSKLFNIDPRFGFEMTYQKSISLRMGVYQFQKSMNDLAQSNRSHLWICQPGAGVGLHIKKFSIDYAYTNLANQSNPLLTHTCSLHLKLPTKNRLN